MSTMNLDGYVAVVTLDEDAAVFHGEVVNTVDVLTFQGRSPDELRQSFRETLEDYVAWCAERGKAPEKPYSGAVALDLGPDLHRRAILAAARSGRSLDTFLRDQVAKAVADA